MEQQREPEDAEPGGGDDVVVQPPRRLTLIAAGTAVLLAVAVVVADAGGRLLALPALLLAVAAVGRDLLAGPVLRADAQGVDVLDGWRRVRSDWAGVERVRAVKDRRTCVLELDLGDAVVALSGTRLGRHPEDVAEDLQRLRRQLRQGDA